MIRNGMFLPPSQFEAWFLSSAISEKDLKNTVNAIDKAMEAVSKM
jgi:glutamate-1-semialdehyde 2,1-aminomutase